jgi:hypothetical protein
MPVELKIANRKITRLVGKANSLKEKASRFEDKRQELLNNALEILRKEQIESYIRLGFHHSLGLSEKEYEESMPNKILIPTDRTLEKYKLPAIVETRICCEELFKLAGINVGEGYNADYIFQRMFPIQQKPYVVWMREKQSRKDMSIEETLNKLDGDERTADIFEGVALAVNYPEILRDKQLAFPKSPVGNYNFQDFASLQLVGEKIEFFIIHQLRWATTITAQQGIT